MISRVADGCFWLARYLERVETLARVLAVHHAMHIDADVAVESRWRRVIDLAGQTEDFVDRVGRQELDDGEAVQRYLTWDAQHPSSLCSTLKSARENARTVREIMSLEAWTSINDLWLWFNGREARRLYDRDRDAFFERVSSATLLFHGVSYATMLHDEPFSFMKLGRAVERAALTVRILDTQGGNGDVVAGSAQDARRCLTVLRSSCAYDPFFHSGLAPLTGRTVTRFMLFDRTLPRSVLYNLDEARYLLGALRRDDPLGLPRRSRTALERLRGELLQMHISDVERAGLHSTLGWASRSIERLCDAIDDDYLNPPIVWLRHCVRALELAKGRTVRAA